MRKNKNKIIAALVIAVVLTGAWFYGGNYNRNPDIPPTQIAQNEETPLQEVYQPMEALAVEEEETDS